MNTAFGVATPGAAMARAGNLAPSTVITGRQSR